MVKIYLDEYKGIKIGDSIKRINSKFKTKGVVAKIEKADNEKEYPDLITFFVIKNGECNNNLNLIHHRQIKKLNYEIPLSYKGKLILQNKKEVIKKYYNI